MTRAHDAGPLLSPRSRACLLWGQPGLPPLCCSQVRCNIPFPVIRHGCHLILPFPQTAIPGRPPPARPRWGGGRRGLVPESCLFVALQNHAASMDRSSKQRRRTVRAQYVLEYMQVARGSTLCTTASGHRATSTSTPPVSWSSYIQNLAGDLGFPRRSAAKALLVTCTLEMFGAVAHEGMPWRSPARPRRRRWLKSSALSGHLARQGAR